MYCNELLGWSFHSIFTVKMCSLQFSTFELFSPPPQKKFMYELNKFNWFYFAQKNVKIIFFCLTCCVCFHFFLQWVITVCWIWNKNAIDFQEKVHFGILCNNKLCIMFKARSLLYIRSNRGRLLGKTQQLT